MVPKEEGRRSGATRGARSGIAAIFQSRVLLSSPFPLAILTNDENHERAEETDPNSAYNPFFFFFLVNAYMLLFENAAGTKRVGRL